ncbi:mechanosensitive ion channel domain-containing protein [Stappia sp.]|uniref:mechanosensitive ion channel domain-containing protein n=1 Tax=Stappia sp. TaxID=1870903 RepID=UPI003A98F56B
MSSESGNRCTSEHRRGLRAVIARAFQRVCAPVLLLAASAFAAAAQTGPGTMEEMAGDRMHVRVALELRDAIGRALAALPEFPVLARDTLIARSKDGTLDWLWTVVPVLAVAILAGLAALRLCENWALARFRHLYDGTPRDRSSKVAYLLSTALFMSLATLAFAAAAGAVTLVLVSGHAAARVSVFIGLEAAALVLGLRIVLRAVLAPRAPSHRMLAFSNLEAIGLYRWIMAVGILTATMIALCEWMNAMGLDDNAHKLMVVVTVGLSCLALTTVAVLYRAALTRLILGDGDGNVPAGVLRRFAALTWLPLLTLYFFSAFVVSGGRVMLDRPAALGLVGAPLVSALIWATSYGLLMLIIDRLLLPRLDSDTNREQWLQDIDRADQTAGEMPDTAANRAQAAAEAMEAESRRSPYRDLLDHGAAILALVVALGYLILRWGVHVSDDSSVVGNLFEIGIVVFLGYLAYRAVEIAIDHQIRLEGGHAGPSEDAEVGGVGESRLATLLPIFRNFLLISIVVIAAMVALSQLGVNIAPIFAGAGVVGLAVGFGAQTLIRDIFSGAFFLIDDAFRKGEYIDIGSVKGTVEKISIRSMQLRHHNGPLNTVPFGDIKYVKNFSRDWAVMKLAFRVTYDTDVEKMRKLIKKFGQELLEHPDYGPKFLQPVKSQGVTALEDSAMIVRVKFMTRPGDQFELRKVVYSGIRDLCEAAGIHFAHREVTVRVAQEPGDTRQFSEEEKKAIAGAVLPALDPQKGPTPAATDATDGR